MTGSKKPGKLALGRGLDSLIPDMNEIDDKPKDYISCDVDLIAPNRYQPRRKFSPEELEALALSIQEHGVLQPLLVRNTDTGYEIIAGERRLRAAKEAGLRQVPVIIKEVTDDRLLEISIVENIQREDLNPVEEADAYHLLMTKFKLTQEQVAEKVSKSRPAVTNMLRLRSLPDQIKETIIDGTISMGHARALLGADTPAQQSDAWRMVVAKKLSVRETEALIKRLKKEKENPEPKPPTPEDTYYTGLEENLSRRFGAKVQIKRRGRKGHVTIDYYSPEDLDRLISLLNPS